MHSDCGGAVWLLAGVENARKTLSKVIPKIRIIMRSPRLFSGAAYRGSCACEISWGVADGLSSALIAGHFQNNDTNTNTMMPISRQKPAILVTVSFMQTPARPDGIGARLCR
jgi:hypothetical protein